jgi:hypothetical protein
MARLPPLKNKMARRTEGSTGQIWGLEFATLSFPSACVWRSRFRGPQTPRRHSARHARVSVSWRDRSDRCRLEFIE